MHIVIKGGIALLLVSLIGCSTNTSMLVADNKNDAYFIFENSNGIQLVFPGMEVGSSLENTTVLVEFYDLDKNALVATIEGTYRKSSAYSFNVVTSQRVNLRQTTNVGISLLRKNTGSGLSVEICSGCAHSTTQKKLKRGFCGCNVLEFFPQFLIVGANGLSKLQSVKFCENHRLSMTRL